MRRTLQIRRNADGTVTVRVGRQVEHFDGAQPRADLFDKIRYSAISMGVVLPQPDLVEVLYEAAREARR